ncbi:MAG: hypothetical protein LBB80_10865 [Treponema sp.]|jgi:hypothetical protein|nr:hypothetical protein [Treponema sp.]
MDTPRHTLIPVADFKTMLGIDNRKAPLSRYCFRTATYTIEQYDKQRILRWKHTYYFICMGIHLYLLGISGTKGSDRPCRYWGGGFTENPLVSPENLVYPEHYEYLSDGYP